MTSEDQAIARAALMMLMSTLLVPSLGEKARTKAQNALAKFFATHRLATLSGGGLAERYRGAMGLVSDMRQAMVQFVEQAEKRINEYVKPESSR